VSPTNPMVDLKMRCVRNVFISNKSNLIYISNIFVSLFYLDTNNTLPINIRMPKKSYFIYIFNIL
jgi:hypothetical protein